MIKLLCLSFIALFALALSHPCNAAFKSAQDGIKKESAWNPNPMDDDIQLPMPCGASMILRPVDISTPGLIVDKRFPMGITDNSDPDRQFYEDKFTGHISSPFTAQSLPPAWKKKLSQQGGGANLTWYFIGKYEVSKYQWNSVMQAISPDGEENPAACPSKAALGDNLPISGISWFEAQAFLSRYNSWLIKNHPNALPSFPDTKNVSFLRLPTEEEWEYAARGGGKVTPDWWQSDNFFPTDGKKMEDFGIFNYGTNYESPLPIGSRNPNPLGLYDTAGNVEEMVDGLFRMSVADMRNGQMERRLHGASGGLVTKGGNFRSDPSKVLPGNREEHALYSINGPVKARDIGFRLALGGLNLDGSARKDELKKEAANPALLGESKGPSVNIDKSATSIGAVEALAAAAEGDIKKNLIKLKTRMEEESSAQAMEDSRNLEQRYRSLLFQAETLRAYAYRYASMKKSESNIKKILRENQVDAQTRKKADESLEHIKESLEGFQRSIIMGANYYKTVLETLLSASSGELSRLGSMTRREYERANDVFNKHMLENIGVLEKIIAQMRKSPAAVTSNGIIKTIIPADHYKLLPISQKRS